MLHAAGKEAGAISQVMIKEQDVVQAGKVVASVELGAAGTSAAKPAPPPKAAAAAPAAKPAPAAPAPAAHAPAAKVRRLMSCCVASGRMQVAEFVST